MNKFTYDLFIGENLLDEESPFTIVKELNSEELSRLLSVLLTKDIEVLVRRWEA